MPLLSHRLPALATAENRVVSTATGFPVLLRGVNRSGLEYSEPGASGFLAAAGLSREDVGEIVHGWGANIIRLPFNQDWALRGRGEWNSEQYREALDAVIGWAAECGAYTLLDLQWLDADHARGGNSDGSANYVAPLPDAGSITLWRALAERYREEPAVLFDLFNEPHNALPDDSYRLCTPDGRARRSRRVNARLWNKWVEALIAAIRSVHPASVVFIGGTNWGYDLKGVPSKRNANVVYSAHVYPGKRPGWHAAFGHFARRFPVFAGEWGFEGEDGAWGRELLSYFRKLDIGWAAWSWRDRPHLFAGDRQSLTPFGELVRAELRV